MATSRSMRFRPRWLILALIVLLVLLAPFLLLSLDPDSDHPNLFAGFSQSSYTRVDAEGNILEHYVNGVPATPQPPQPDRCGQREDEFVPVDENRDEVVHSTSISIGCWKLFERIQKQ